MNSQGASSYSRVNSSLSALMISYVCWVEGHNAWLAVGYAEAMPLQREIYER